MQHSALLRSPAARCQSVSAASSRSRSRAACRLSVSAFLGRDATAQQQAQKRDQASTAEKQLAAGTTLLQTPSRVASLMAQPGTCLSALAGFALVAANIPVSSTADPLQATAESLSSQSALQQLLATSSSTGAAQAASLPAAASTALQAVLGNPVLQLDEAIHQFVASNTTEAFRLMADVWISDAFITAGVLGWLACTAACLIKAPAKSAAPLSAAWGFYFATCGAVGHGDPLLVDALKHFFARARPSTLHHTFSFPSGHTSAAVFIVGGLLTVLLPLALQSWASSSSSSSNQQGRSGGTGETSSEQDARVVAGILAADAAVLGVWAAAWGCTAAGRILSESHWLSDTLAGGLLAVASVSGMALTSRLLLPDCFSQTNSMENTSAAAGSAAPPNDS